MGDHSITHGRPQYYTWATTVLHMGDHSITHGRPQYYTWATTVLHMGDHSITHGRPQYYTWVTTVLHMGDHNDTKLCIQSDMVWQVTKVIYEKKTKVTCMAYDKHLCVCVHACACMRACVCVKETDRQVTYFDHR